MSKQGRIVGRGTRTRREDSILADAVKGALAGAAATWVMGQATSYLYQHEEKSVQEEEKDARGGQTAYGTAAVKAADMVGQELSDEQRKQYGSAIHWALGAGAGAVYGMLRHRVPGADAGNGLLFGTAFRAVIDEGANTALGLTPGPTAFPWQTHARGLAGHLVFGVAADTALRPRWYSVLESGSRPGSWPNASRAPSSSRDRLLALGIALHARTAVEA